jgi:hypothetical protein
MKRFLMVIALGFALSITVLAGDIPSVPGPQPSSQGMTINPSPDIPSVEAADQLSSDALSALLAALSFLAV